jgi:hypothetical protein
MRCPDCNKFASYDEPEVEENSIDDATSIEVTVGLNCADCGGRLKEAQITLALGEEPSHQDPACDGTWMVKNDAVDYEPSTRTEGTGRGTKTFYGAKASWTVECDTCHASHEVTAANDEQASNFEEA